MAAAAIMPRRRGNPAVLVAAGVVLVVGVLLVARNVAHANAKHAEAEAIRAAYLNGLCVAAEAWFSPTRGTVLVLCQLDAVNWGGMVFRFTENNGQTLLGENAYEATCFAADRAYWERVRVRDGYWALGGFGSVDAAFWTWLRMVL